MNRAAAAAKRRLDEAWRQSAALVPAWRSAVARAVRRYGMDDVRARVFAAASRDVGHARLDRGIPTSRRSLDRLMKEAFQLYLERRHRSYFRPCGPQVR